MTDTNQFRVRLKTENPDHYRKFVRRTNLRVKYGITPEEYDEMLRKQNGRCAICATAAPGKRGFFVDHNHKTKKVRLLLCHACNTGLGYFKENPILLAKAIQYLSEHK